MQYTDRHAINSRQLELAEELSAGCDADFDQQDEALEREFAGLRPQFTSIE